MTGACLTVSQVQLVGCGTIICIAVARDGSAFVRPIVMGSSTAKPGKTRAAARV